MVEIRKAQNKHPPNAQRSTTGGEIPIMHEAVSCQTREIKLWGNALIAGFPFQGTSTFPVYCLVLSSIFKSDWCHGHFLKCLSNACLFTNVLFLAKSLLDGQSGRWRAAWVWSQLLERMQVLCSLCFLHGKIHFSLLWKRLILILVRLLNLDLERAAFTRNHIFSRHVTILRF